MLFNRQSVHIALLLWGCIFCLLAALCLHLSRDLDREKKKYILLLELSGSILLGSDAVAWGFRGVPGTLGRYMVHISNFLVFAFSDILLFLYHAYLCCNLFEKNPQEKEQVFRVKLVSIIAMTALCLVILSQFINLYYYIDAKNYYHRHPAHFLSMILPMAGMFVDLSLLIQYRRKLDRELMVAMASYIILPLVASVIQMYHYGISLINLSVCISVILMFVEILIAQSRKSAQRERQLAEQERALAQKERELTDSRIASMMSQIRNHFIFNVLGTISTYCKTDPEKADEALIRFSRYLRRNMNYLEEKGMIPFEREIAQLEDYVSLEQMRFGDMVEFDEDFEETDFKIPPLTVQPLVENAIKHGLTKTGKKGCVRVLTRQEEGAVIIEILDNGIGFRPEELEKKGSLGIRNIRYRLEHMADGTLHIESTPGEGTRAVIRIPIGKEGTKE